MTFQIKRRGELPLGPLRLTSVHRNVPALVQPAGVGHIQYPYNGKWSCPLTPFENRLRVPVRAGEKVFMSAAHK